MEFYRLFSELLRVYQFRDRTRICYYDISVTQCYAISALIRLGPVRQKKLAADLCLDKSTTSRVIDSLERKDYVTRTTDPQDGRAFLLEVTDRGRALHSQIEKDLIEEYAGLLSDVDPEVRRAIIRLMKRLYQITAERFKGYVPGYRIG
jgi:DNA-binding MarR family transcriptional regulator